LTVRLAAPIMFGVPLKYREDKATQAAGRLLARLDNRANHMKLIKLLYLADREALVKWGRPITFDWYFSLPHGPVLSFTLDRINEEPGPEGPSYWHQFISPRENNEVKLLRGTPSTDLSRAEEVLLDSVIERFGHMNQWELRDYCHSLPEWQDPQGSRLPIAVRDILLAEGLSEVQAVEIEEALEAETVATRLLG
jgi:uncharacterized phage-associated protein